MKPLLSVLVLLVNLIKCDKWSDEFAKKLKDMDVLTKEMESLQGRLTKANSDISDTKTEMLNLKNKIEDIPNTIKKR